MTTTTMLTKTMTMTMTMIVTMTVTATTATTTTRTTFGNQDLMEAARSTSRRLCRLAGRGTQHLGTASFLWFTCRFREQNRPWIR